MATMKVRLAKTGATSEKVGTGAFTNVEVHQFEGVSARIDKPFTDVDDSGNHTYTSAELQTGMVLRNPAGTNRTEVLPAASTLFTDFNLAATGDFFDVQFLCVPAYGVSNTVTFANGSNTFGSGVTLAANTYKTLRFLRMVSGSTDIVKVLAD